MVHIGNGFFQAQENFAFLAGYRRGVLLLHNFKVDFDLILGFYFAGHLFDSGFDFAQCVAGQYAAIQIKDIFSRYGVNIRDICLFACGGKG